MCFTLSSVAENKVYTQLCMRSSHCLDIQSLVNSLWGHWLTRTCQKPFKTLYVLCFLHCLLHLFTHSLWASVLYVAGWYDVFQVNFSNENPIELPYDICEDSNAFSLPLTEVPLHCQDSCWTHSSMHYIITSSMSAFWRLVLLRCEISWILIECQLKTPVVANTVHISQYLGKPSDTTLFFLPDK